MGPQSDGERADGRKYSADADAPHHYKGERRDGRREGGIQDAESPSEAVAGKQRSKRRDEKWVAVRKSERQAACRDRLRLSQILGAVIRENNPKRNGRKSRDQCNGEQAERNVSVWGFHIEPSGSRHQPTLIRRAVTTSDGLTFIAW